MFQRQGAIIHWLLPPSNIYYQNKIRIKQSQIFGLSYFDRVLATLKHDHSGLPAYPVQEMRRKKYA